MAKRLGEIKSDAQAAVDNLTATANPTVNDCHPEYDVGSRWVNIATQYVYFCTDSTEGAAVWKQITNQGGSFSGTLDDISAGSTNVHLTTTLKTKLDGINFSGLVKITVGTSVSGTPATGDLWIDTN